MSKTLFAVINPVVKSVLRSPLHGLMSRNTMLLEFQGRKTGRRYSTPVTYLERDGTVHCFTDRTNAWWRNLQDGAEVRLTLRGDAVTGKSTVVTDGGEEMQRVLVDFLRGAPRDASYAGVELDSAGEPRADHVAAAAGRLAWIRIEPAHGAG